MSKAVGLGRAIPPTAIIQLHTCTDTTFIQIQWKGIHASMFVHVNIGAQMWNILCVWVCACVPACVRACVRLHWPHYVFYMSHRGERGMLPFREIKRFLSKIYSSVQIASNSYHCSANIRVHPSSSGAAENAHYIQSAHIPHSSSRELNTTWIKWSCGCIQGFLREL